MSKRRKESSNIDLYCLCKKPAGNSFMLLCKLCKTWFHGKYVGVKRSQKIPHAWTCDTCSKRCPKKARFMPDQEIRNMQYQLRDVCTEIEASKKKIADIEEDNCKVDEDKFEGEVAAAEWDREASEWKAKCERAMIDVSKLSKKIADVEEENRKVNEDSIKGEQEAAKWKALRKGRLDNDKPKSKLSLSKGIVSKPKPSSFTSSMDYYDQRDSEDFKTLH